MYPLWPCSPVKLTASHFVGQSVQRIPDEVLNDLVGEGVQQQAETDNQEEKIQPELQKYINTIIIIAAQL